MTSSQCSLLSHGPEGGIPAEQTSASREPPQILSAAASIGSSPASPTSISAPSMLAAFRSMPTTRQPAASSHSTVAWPMPAAAPVTMAVFCGASSWPRHGDGSGQPVCWRPAARPLTVSWRRRSVAARSVESSEEPRSWESPRTCSSDRTSTYGVRSSTLRWSRGLRSSSRCAAGQSQHLVLGARSLRTKGLGDVKHGLRGAGQAGIT